LVALTTRSEALQQVLRRESCPFALECDAFVTRNFFDRICNSTGYTNCHHFARRVGELQTPFEWLQKFAVHENDKNVPAGMGEAATVDAGR
jgi:hypothetical protein